MASMGLNFRNPHATTEKVFNKNPFDFWYLFEQALNGSDKSTRES